MRKFPQNCPFLLDLDLLSRIARGLLRGKDQTLGMEGPIRLGIIALSELSGPRKQHAMTLPGPFRCPVD